MSAHPSVEVETAKRDFDRFDAICDHLLVIDEQRADLPGGVVGTYRLLRSSVAQQNGGFYSSDEYEISRLVGFGGETLELGRSCVEEEYRNRPTMQSVMAKHRPIYISLQYWYYVRVRKYARNGS